jgi:TrkA-C domain
MSPCLLPGARNRGGKGGGGNDDIDDSAENLLLGARLTQWSPAAGRTVQRSGLRDTGGIYLVSVHRFLTGNVHRAMSKDFVLNVGDILYFTCLVESFGEFCEEHGLEVVTNEVEQANSIVEAATGDTDTAMTPQQPQEWIEVDDETPESDMAPHTADLLMPIAEGNDIVPREIGITKESLLQADAKERLRSIHRMTDMIRKAGADAAAGSSPDGKATSLGVGTTTAIPVGTVVATTVGAVVATIPSPRQQQHNRGPAAQQRLAYTLVMCFC